MFTATGFLAVLAIAATPALSQETGDSTMNTAVETTVVEEDASSQAAIEAEIAEEIPTAISADDLDISTLELQLLLDPLTVDELQVEADAWVLALREQVDDISHLELAIERQNAIIGTRKDVQAKLAEAESNNASQAEIDDFQRELNKLEGQETRLQAEPGFKEVFDAAKLDYAVKLAPEVLDKAQNQLSSVQTESDIAAELVQTLEKHLTRYQVTEAKIKELVPGTPRYESTREALEERKDEVANASETVLQAPMFSLGIDTLDLQQQLRDQMVTQATVLKTERSALTTRVQTVLDELDKKGGDIESYDRYAKAVTGLDFDITDAQGIKVRFLTWLQSEDGGISWGIGLLKFCGILAAAFIVAPRVGKIANNLLSKIQGMSTLFRDFTVMVIKRGVLVVGALLALAALGVDLGPVLAVVGGASFVVAFALQSNLANFASGLMLLINKPFDVGDEVKVAGYWAYVHSISLASTKLKDFGGSMITLPNNTVWGGDIINYTHADIRKISLGVNVKFTQDVDQLQEIWLGIVSSHSKVLQDPTPGIFPWSATYDYKMWVGLNAWATKGDYWGVYVDLLKALQKQLDANNIELAAPVQEIKLNGSTGKTIDVPGTTVNAALPQDVVA